jgi:hypothetical protein
VASTKRNPSECTWRGHSWSSSGLGHTNSENIPDH